MNESNPHDSIYTTVPPLKSDFAREGYSFAPAPVMEYDQVPSLNGTLDFGGGGVGGIYGAAPPCKFKLKNLKFKI